MNLCSLHDIIHNSTVSINNSIIINIIDQIIDGMIYLHNYKIPIIHNNLKSTNLLLNNNFNLKISDFNFLCNNKKNLFYIAPEIIKNNNITKKCDIYSFGIILYELVTEKEPYYNIDDNIDNIIIRIIDNNNPLRPFFKYEIYSEIKKIIISCWDNNYILRPTFENIKKNFNEIKYEYINFINNLILYSKNQQYELVDNYPINIKKAILYNKQILPINYNDVSILFIDICNYTYLCSNIDNDIIIKMLINFNNKLDELTLYYDLVKIGNVGDCYIVSSKLEENNKKNILIIALFALDAIEIIKSIYIDENKKELGFIQIRIGINVGNIIGHILGNYIKKFSLYGDTVNVTSRLESTSKINYIHCLKSVADYIYENDNNFEIEYRGFINIKGKGLIETSFIKSYKKEIIKNYKERRHSLTNKSCFFNDSYKKLIDNIE